LSKSNRSTLLDWPFVRDMQGISFCVEPDPEWVRMDKRLLARATPRVRLICDCLEETIFAEASPIVFGIACHQIGGPQIVDCARLP
jgi:hypothetical protein